MAIIEEIMDEDPQAESQKAPENGSNGAANVDNAIDARAQERMCDADEIEAALAHISRPSARLHVQNLITKLRKEGKALQRVAASSCKADAASSMEVDDPTTEPPHKSSNDINSAFLAQSAPVPTRTPAAVPHVSTSKYQAFPTYFFDAGAYNSPTVSVYVPLEGIGQHDRSKISCTFTPSSFDLVVTDFEGKSYRLLNDNLEKDIQPEKSKYILKPNKIIIKLGKVKGEYSYDHWSQLTAKKAKKKDVDGKRAKEDPAAGIMDLMRDMYEEGDDNMKRMIGETMYKQRTGQLDKMDPLKDMGGLGGF